MNTHHNAFSGWKKILFIKVGICINMNGRCENEQLINLPGRCARDNGKFARGSWTLTTHGGKSRRSSTDVQQDDFRAIAVLPFSV